jgi:TolA-binding protein
MMKKFPVIVLATLLASPAAFPASREQQEMQRDIAQLQDQVRALQSGFDQKMAALQTLVQQAVDAGQKANVSANVLSSTVTQTLEREITNRLTPVAGVSSKVDNLANDLAEVKNSLADLNSQMNKLRAQLTDVNNAVKIIQVPAAPPPGPSANGAAPPVPATALFANALGDYSSGKSDLALSEFSDYLKYYPNESNAATALSYIGRIHMAQGKYDMAVVDFDSILERFPEGPDTPDAWIMKGMALKQGGHRDDAAKEFRALYKKSPKSPQGIQAADQLKAMGLSVGAAAPAARRK